MTLQQWLFEVMEAYELYGKQLSSDKVAFLLTDLPENLSKSEESFIAEVYETVFRFFFYKASRGEPFGPINRIKERFGISLEENYGLTSGPFINIARTYWTYKIEVMDLFPQYKNFVLANILLKIENDIASVFFPMPGPVKMPVKLRRETQRKILKEFAPQIDIERFLTENPILQADESRRGCFGILIGLGVILGFLLTLKAC